ncbi:histidine phosphatase family protein [Anaerobacillus sp. CMMVII]|uniref:histidine phosphatase family protein n=1 Tax=Anaerobacillus sp. CMMVII TaxID=2755588 RepID=UPI0021B8345C|nr:histidine phosphatase family protein [Anaerobacillus sp. CMMVII]
MYNQTNWGYQYPQPFAPYYTLQPHQFQATSQQNYSSLLNSLQGGGYILYARHATANVGRDQPGLSFQDCYTQRNLSDTGRRQSIAYGEALRRLRIPVSYPVGASPFCRTIETTTLAFGEENVQVEPFWIEIYNLSANLPPAEQNRILNYLHAIFEFQPPAGFNQVIIAHSFPPGVGLGQIPDMGTVIVRPRGQGNSYEIVAKLSLDELMNLR